MVPSLRNSLTIACAVLCVAALGVAPVQSQPRYGSWRQEPDKLETLIQELRALIDEADSARAADPRFLRDLRALANRHVDPWAKVLIHDEFRDGDLTKDPTWIVDSGLFETRYGGGLRSLSVPVVAAPAPRQDSGQRKARPEDLAALLLGQILKQDQRTQPSRPAPDPAPTAESQPGEIHLDAAVTNAFALEMTLQVDALSGAFGVAVYQTPDRQTGYRLTLASSGDFHLERRGARGTVAIASAASGVRTQTAHKVTWTRAQDGAMAVTLDNTAILNVADRSFLDNWRGLSLTNTGGDITISAITVKGAR